MRMTPLNVSDAAFARREAYINRLIESADNTMRYMSDLAPGSLTYELAEIRLAMVRGQLEGARAILMRTEAQRFGFAYPSPTQCVRCQRIAGNTFQPVGVQSSMAEDARAAAFRALLSDGSGFKAGMDAVRKVLAADRETLERMEADDTDNVLADALEDFRSYLSTLSEIADLAIEQFERPPT
jgi:hypothetical protein